MLALFQSLEKWLVTPGTTVAIIAGIGRPRLGQNYSALIFFYPGWLAPCVGQNPVKLSHSMIRAHLALSIGSRDYGVRRTKMRSSGPPQRTTEDSWPPPANGGRQLTRISLHAISRAGFAPREGQNRRMSHAQ